MGATLVHIHLLGRFGVDARGHRVPVETWRRRRRAAQLVQLLALASDQTMPREQVMAALWPELNEAAAARNLRKAAHHARQIMGIDEFVVLDGVTVQLWPGATITTDLGGFQDAAQSALGVTDSDQRRELARQALSRYGGELLPEEAGQDWRDMHASIVEGLYRDVLLAAEHWGQVLTLDPTDELAHRGIIRDRLEAGDRTGAIRQFDTLRLALRDELGVAPAPESVELYERVLASDGPDTPTPAERARALLAWGTVHWERSDLDEAARAARDARALAIDAGLGRELADASELRGLVAYAQGHWRQVFADDLRESIASTPELTPFLYDSNLCMCEFAIHEPNGLDEMSATAAALVTAAEGHGSLVGRSIGLLLRAEVDLLAGADANETRTNLQQSQALHTAVGAISGRALAVERLAQLENRAKRRDVADQLHAEAVALAKDSAVAGHLLPLIFGGMLDDVPTARGEDVLHQANDDLAGVEACKPCSMSFHLGAARLHADRHRLEDAHQHLEAARSVSTMWTGGPWHAAVDEVDARVRRIEGAPTGVVRELLANAVVAFEESGRSTDAERCRVALHSLA